MTFLNKLKKYTQASTLDFDRLEFDILIKALSHYKYKLKDEGRADHLPLMVDRLLGKLKHMNQHGQVHANVFYVTVDGQDFEYASSKDAAKKTALNARNKFPKGKIEVEEYAGKKPGGGGALLNTYQVDKAGKLTSAKEPTKNLTVLLGAGINPDYSPAEQEIIKPHKVKVSSPEEASKVVQKFIDTHGIGSGQWYAADAGWIFDGNKKIGRISYNGRIAGPLEAKAQQTGGFRAKVASK